MTSLNRRLTLMDLCADGAIPEPSAHALELVGLEEVSNLSSAEDRVRLLMATAMTLVQQGGGRDREGRKVIRYALSDLQGSCNMATAALGLGR